MIKVAQNEEQDGDVVSTAIRWFVRLRAEDKTEIEHDQFFDWLFESQTNQQAFAEIVSLWDSLAVVQTLPLGERSDEQLNEQSGELFEEQSALNLLQKPVKNTNLSNTELSRIY